MKIKGLARPRGAGGVAALGAGLVAASLLLAAEARAEDPDGRMRELEDTVRLLQDEVVALREERRSERGRVEEVETSVSHLEGALSRVKLGGYGSMRWDNSSLGDVYNTFTLRRLVMTTAAQITPRLSFYSEIEYERFRKLELERETRPAGQTETSPDGIKLVQEIEGTDGSEIALEQAWMEFDLAPESDWSLGFRAGGMLVPVGRFNQNHDDNVWNLTRRSLIDRGSPVLPAAAAWDEMGLGLAGALPLGEGRMAWELYVMNGASLEAELETVVAIRDQPGGRRDKIELELELTPQTGTFSNDTKESKALTGRLLFQPSNGDELGLSFYTSRYTPDYLSDETSWVFGVDGIKRLGGLEIEAEYLFAHYSGVPAVARSLARVAVESSVNNSSAFDPTVETEIEIDLKNLAKTKHGYWIELRYPFWPEGLSDTWLGKGFGDPRLVPVVRWEQVFFRDRVTDLSFSGGAITSFASENRTLNRLTTALAFRPTPLVGFTLAYEYLFADGKNLDGLTNYLPNGIREDAAHFASFGATFGF